MNFPNITLPSSFFFPLFLKRNLLQFYRHHTPAGDLQISISSTNFSQHFKISMSHGSRYLQLSIFNINSSSSHIIKFSTLLKDRKNMNYSPPSVSVGGLVPGPTQIQKSMYAQVLQWALCDHWFGITYATNLRSHMEFAIRSWLNP